MAPLATPERVLAVEPIGRRDLVGLATSTRTVIVEGLLSHNSFPDLDIKNLTRDQAIRIYRRDYWDSLGCDRFPPPIAIALFDGAVNQGPVAAVRMLQRALGVTVDGVIGPETLAAARAVKAEALLGDFLADRAVEYAGLRTFPRFGRDWMRRLFAVQQVCLRAAP